MIVEIRKSNTSAKKSVLPYKLICFLTHFYNCLKISIFYFSYAFSLFIFLISNC